MVRSMARAGTEAAEELARMAVDETGYGVYEHKIVKNRYNTTFVARYMLRQRAVGVLRADPINRMTAVGVPMGVIAGLIPRTKPTSTLLFKALAAVESKSFDNGTACVAEQAIVLDEAIAARALEGLAAAGMALLDPSQHAALARVIFDERGALRPDPVGQSAVRLAELAGVSVPGTTKALGVRLTEVGRHEPLSAEIL